MRACRAKGVRVPQDVAVLGVDDDPLFCSFTDPKLSSVDPNAEEVGREAVRALAESLLRKRGRTAARDVFVKPRGVTVRESTDVYRVDHPWLGKALEFIHRDPAACITAADVFAHVGLSHTIVDREFRSKLGTSVQKEIMKARLDRAAELLANTSRPVAEVAERSGFASFPYFCSSFSSRFRTTAVRYRELQKKKTKLHN
jgi:LacI family transcriptional regulator